MLKNAPSSDIHSPFKSTGLSPIKVQNHIIKSARHVIIEDENIKEVKAISSIMSDLKLEIRTVLEQVLNDELPSDDTDLVETGMLDSLALVSLIMELETSFGIEIDFDALELESFRSVKSIETYVNSLKS